MFTAAHYSYYPLKAFADFTDLARFAIDHELLIELWLEDQPIPEHIKPIYLSSEGFISGRYVETITIGSKALGPETMIRLSKVYAARLCRASGLDESENDELSRPPRPPV